MILQPLVGQSVDIVKVDDPAEQVGQAWPEQSHRTKWREIGLQAKRFTAGPDIDRGTRQAGRKTAA